ncbi:MAG: hypothetical protein COY40_03610 [Alphaproteobacteria bacterium CG_4_10_14_0_8_um_filter_53_9]|nr:MAG: hypothetical protein COY40_03610 [Alphaproteobacteria bacterium CG_4_10_14_0_8_um_filter_53_9]
MKETMDIIGLLTSFSGYFLAVQLVGFMAAGVDIYSTTHKNDRLLMMTVVVASFLWALHYAGLGAWAAVGAVMLTVGRYLSALYIKNAFMAGVFMFLYLLAIPITYETPVDVLPYVAGFIATYALFYRKGASMRGFFIVAACLRFIFALVMGSYPAMLLNFILSAGHVRTILALNRASVAVSPPIKG